MNTNHSRQCASYYYGVPRSAYSVFLKPMLLTKLGITVNQKITRPDSDSFNSFVFKSPEWKSQRQVIDRKNLSEYETGYSRIDNLVLTWFILCH